MLSKEEIFREFSAFINTSYTFHIHCKKAIQVIAEVYLVIIHTYCGCYSFLASYTHSNNQTLQETM